tara:strand:+ start:3742 stop:4380 length:639 start_codon:yes stop_codon:yes gene_type:complete
MLEIKNKSILVLAPHTDDAEFGCGGTIAKLIEKGNDVYCVAFSACKQSVLKNFPSDVLIKEVKTASKVLGINEENLILYDFEVRTFNYKRQEILDCILDLKKKIKPDFVFIPSINDVHQDHFTIAQESLRAFKYSNLLCYELPWNNLTFNTSCFCVLNEEHISKKIEAIKQYESQKHRTYASEDFIRSLAKVRGTQINTEFAECFEVLRLKF